MPSDNRSTANSAARFAPVYFLALLAFLAVARALLTGQTIGAFGLAKEFGVPGVEGVPWPVDLLQLDGVLQFYPWRDLVFSAWGLGQWPLYNPYTLMGTPLLANAQSGGLYPPHILLGLLKFPTDVAIGLLAWFHLALLAVGLYRLTRALGGGWLAAMIAAVSGAFCPFVFAWLPLASVVSTVAWIPWILWGLVDRRRLAWAGAACAMMLIAGHLQFAAFGLMGALTLGLAQAILTRDKKSWLGLVALGLGALVAIGALLPVIDFSAFSHRRNAPSEEGYQAYVASALRPADLANLVVPTALGAHSAKIDASIALSPSEYWPAHPLNGRPSANFAELALTLGPLTWFGLFFVAWRRDRAVWVMTAVALLGVLIAFGTPFCRLLYFGVPGWSGTGSPGRAIILAILALSVAGGLGWQRALRELDAKSTWRLAGAAALLGLLVTVSSQWAGPPEASRATLAPLVAKGFLNGLMGLMVLLVPVGLLIYFARRDERATKVSGAVGLVWVAIAMMIMVPIPTGRVTATPQPSLERVAVVAPEVIPGAYRLNPPNWNAVLRQPRIDGYDSLIHRDTVAILKDLQGGKDPAVLVNGNFMAPAFETAPRGVGVSRLVTPDGAVIDETGEDRASLDGRALPLTSEGPMGLSLDVPSSGELTVFDRTIPGWRAYQAGRPLTLQPGPFLKVDVPAAGRVEFVYWPFRVHPLIPALIGLLGLWALGRYAKKNLAPTFAPQELLSDHHGHADEELGESSLVHNA